MTGGAEGTRRREGRRETVGTVHAWGPPETLRAGAGTRTSAQPGRTTLRLAEVARAAQVRRGGRDPQVAPGDQPGRQGGEGFQRKFNPGGHQHHGAAAVILVFLRRRGVGVGRAGLGGGVQPSVRGRTGGEEREHQHERRRRRRAQTAREGGFGSAGEAHQSVGMLGKGLGVKFPERFVAPGCRAAVFRAPRSRLQSGYYVVTVPDRSPTRYSLPANHS